MRNVLDPADSGSVEEANTFVLHLIFAFDLFNHELGISENPKLFTSREDGKAQRRQKSRIFGVVVRPGPEILGNADDAGKIHAAARLARISARAAVDIGG